MFLRTILFIDISIEDAVILADDICSCIRRIGGKNAEGLFDDDGDGDGDGDGDEENVCILGALSGIGAVMPG